jgi:hypothetical protein
MIRPNLVTLQLLQSYSVPKLSKAMFFNTLHNVNKASLYGDMQPLT